MLHRSALRAAAAAALLLVSAPTVAAAEPVRIMPVGDSITQGAGGDYTWRYDLWQDLASVRAEGGVDLVGDRTALFNATTNKQDGNHLYLEPDFDQDHHGIWARALIDEALTIGSVLRAQSPRPDVLLVHLGTNDAPRGVARGAGAMRTLIANARAAAPDVDIVIGRLYPLYANGAKTYQNTAFVRDLNAQFGVIAAGLDTPTSRVVVADTAAGFDAAKHTWDGRHPTPTGESIIAAGFADALAELGVGEGATPATHVWPLAGPKPTVTSGAAGAVAVSWSASVPGALAYRLERRDVTAGSAWSTVGTIPFGTTATSLGGLVRAHTYAFRLTPVRGTMVGQPGPETEVLVAGTAVQPAPTRSKPWWQWW